MDEKLGAWTEEKRGSGGVAYLISWGGTAQYPIAFEPNQTSQINANPTQIDPQIKQIQGQSYLIESV
jgi:hypothetical protein